MTDKKTFGSFIKSKRTEKNYSQKDLAEMLIVTEGAVSKWERGVSYPDITLIPDICRALEISEHELITASTDMDTRKMKHEARKFRAIRSAWFWIPTVTYAAALLVCFICNLAVQGTLSWFYIVLAALLCAYTFVPTVTLFFEERKLLAFSLSTYLSICLLLLTCAIYTGGLSWLLTACLGIAIGYVLVFVPILLAKSRLTRQKFIISFSAGCLLTVLLVMNVRFWHPFPLLPGILITCYAYTPAILCAVICALSFDAFLKAGICTAFSAFFCFFANFVVDLLFQTSESSYAVNFYDWQRYAEGNINHIVLAFCLLLGVVFIAIGISRCHRRRKR